MAILTPKFVALDSATLNKIAADHFSGEERLRTKAQSLVRQLAGGDVYITLTFTHLCELFSHKDRSKVDDRIRWLRGLPFIAWVRPYDGSWFPGGMTDIILRELHAIVHDGAIDWATVIGNVQPTLLETGVGSEMFVDRPELWELISQIGRRLEKNQQYIASVARAEDSDVGKTKLKHIMPIPPAPQTEASKNRQLEKLAEGIESKLVKHGDERLPPKAAADAFVNDPSLDIAKVDAIGGELGQAIMDFFGVPKELVSQKMTVEQVVELATHAKQLEIACKKLRPPASRKLTDIPPGSIPSFTIQRALTLEQNKADHVSGSDLGDQSLIPLAFYLDALEVDKRTHDHVRKIRQRDAKIAAHLRHVFRSPDYSSIPATLAKLGVI